jgi:hypothetical protein
MTTPRFLADEDLRHSLVTAAHRLEPTLGSFFCRSDASRID